VKPLYPFGYGLSYTRFQFNNLRIEPMTAQAGDEVAVELDISNVGDRAGDEVVQLYIHQTVPYVTRPVKELKAFKRVTLESKQTQTIVFSTPINQLGFYDRDLNFVIEPGTVEVMVGSSSQDIHCVGSFVITGEKTDISEHKTFFSRASLTS
jgi:beta-glucosidase